MLKTGIQYSPKTALNKRVGIRNLFYSQKFAPYVFVAPFIIAFLLFFLYPILSTLTMSFQQVMPGENIFIGLKNYQQLLNTHFYIALYNSVRYTIWTLLLLIPLPMILAVLLNSKRMPFRNFFRSTLFIPALTSVIVAGTIFRLVFGEADTALANSILLKLGFSSHKWLMNSHTGMFLMVLLACWRWMGVNVLYFLAGLQNISQELYESAEIDGANTLTKFLKITLPLLKPVTIYVLTISIFGGLSQFTESFVYWSNQSPADIGLTIVGYIYKQGFEYNNMGLGSAIGITLLAMVLIINLIQLKFFGLFKKGE